MLNKSPLLKNYLNDIGTRTQVFFFFGYTPNPISSNTVDSGIDVWKNSEMSYRMGRKDSIAVVPNYTWASGNLYHYWKSSDINVGSYYAWNKSNGIVYLCLSNNPYNRKELSLSNLSTQLPSHSYGIQKYSDGYTWLPLYRITSDLLRFVNSTWIPVISFDDYRENIVSKYTAAERFCSNDQGSDVDCAIYCNQTISVETSYNTFTNYLKGELFQTISGISCQNCYYLFENDDRYVSVPYAVGSDIPTSISIKDNFDKVEELVTTNQISTSSPYYSLYTISANGLNDGAIVSALIDLTGFTESQLVVSQANPEISISSSTGTNARLIFTTYKNLNGENIINGVSLISNGENYRDYSLSISETLFPYMSYTEVESLLASIEVNVDILDGLNFDPVSALDAENIMFDIRIETNVLKQNSLSVPAKINFYGLIENPVEYLNDGSEIVAGSQYGKDDSYIDKTTIKILPDTGLAIEPVGELGKVSLVNGSVVNNISITNQNPITDEVELSGINYTDAYNISTVTLNGVMYPVISVQSVPPFKQYSGKVTQTKKLSNELTFGNDTSQNENTKLFRINIVKGM